ncbi:uncharacterized protein LOC110636053 isoform X2 [Hevea brasiliensis]|uniref:uncharacterized protein LOC110636053 isoform X2 n=1 Tax=Hevea brasiliensis TaxID=3981 RepID=UPI0025E344F1|nr:uncharacterized protein LOC110636053 isoform X2 [Hevea brasiliensis]
MITQPTCLCLRNRICSPLVMTSPSLVAPYPSPSSLWQWSCLYRCRFEPRPRGLCGSHCGNVDTVHHHQASTSFQPRVGLIKAGLSHFQHVYTMWGDLKRTLSKFSGANYPNKDPYRAKVILAPEATEGGFHCRWVVGLSAWANGAQPPHPPSFLPKALSFQKSASIAIILNGALLAMPLLSSFFLGYLS